MEAAIDIGKHKTLDVQFIASTLTSVVLLASYALIAKPAFTWIVNELERDLSIAALISIVLALALTVWKFGLPVKPLSLHALGLIAFSGVLSILTFPILQQLSASFALLGAYGFFASFRRISPVFWRKGLLMGGLTAIALPFALVPGTGMGFYLRLLTADAAAQLLALMGHASLGAHDVLIFDNGIAQVDLPCSGLKSLFTGTGFFCVASLLLRRDVNVKWMLGYAVFAGLLIIANAIRVTVLIWVSEILQQRDIAETIHMPLGLMLFCIVCACGIYILYRLKPFGVEEPDTRSIVKYSILTRSLLSFCVGAIFLAVIGLSPKAPQSGHGTVTLPDALTVTNVALTPTETRFFGARERTSAGKWIFEYHGLSGSMLVVRSGAANGLHAPEVCMLGNGISVDTMQSRTFGAGQFRYLTVDNGRRNAVYWMQGEQTVTDDFRKRLNKFILGAEDDWIMVTLLFDDRLNLAQSSENKAALDRLMQLLQSHYSQEIKRKRDRDDST